MIDWLPCLGGPSDGLVLPIHRSATERFVRADVTLYPMITPECERSVERVVRYVRSGDQLEIADG